MGDLEHVCRQIGDSLEERLLGPGSDVGGQEMANAPHFGAQDQRGFVARATVGGARPGGPEDFEDEVLDLDPFPVRQPPHDHAMALRPGRQRP